MSALPKVGIAVSFEVTVFGEGVKRMLDQANGDSGKVVLWLEQSLSEGLAGIGFDVDCDLDAASLSVMTPAAGPATEQGGQDA